MINKVHRAFDFGQAYSYRPNDDGGAGYQVLVPSHHLSYSMAEGDDSFLASGHLKSVVDLMIATLDNRMDPVTFGDIGNYSHRKKGAPQVGELKFFKMAAWYYEDGQYQWLYNWMSRDCVIDLDVWGAFSTGLYAVDIQEEEPSRYVGVFPVMLDDASLRWSARRSEKKAWFPLDNKHYFDKITFRSSFNPQDEYLLLDGTSTFAHGHQDGNTITRLTWKDRIWLFDADYIKSTPRYHNGVIVVRDGVQEAPPPLNVLDYAADFNSIGFTQTTSKDYNGADWERNIIWKKGRYFLFLDQVKALKSGDYRLENRWRTRGDVNLDENVLSVHQGDKSFYIKSADEASRTIVIEPDGYGSVWDYPYGNCKMSVCLARKNMTMARNSEWIFANLMYAVDDSDTNPIELYKISDDLYLISDSENRELVGFRANILEAEGVYTNCSLFLKDSKHTYFINASRLKFEDIYFEAPANVHIEIDYRKSTGKLVIPEGSEGLFYIRNLFFKDVAVQPGKKNNALKLNPGSYVFAFRKDLWENKTPLKTLFDNAHRILPESPSNKIIEFGIEVIRKIDISDTITSFYPNGSELIYADNNGKIKKYDGKNKSLLFRIPSQRPIKSVHAADINGDGKAEIIAGDDSENLYCYNNAGKLLWENKLRPFKQYAANAVNITTGIIDESGKPTVLVTTTSWKLFAFNPEGTLKWESFIYYHPLTKVKILKNKNNQPLIAVGTTYQTPLNIVNPDDGKVIWFTWEQVGSESNATTDYCGKHLTDMVFVDTDKDGEKEVVFGTKHHRVYALDAADGCTKWEAPVGDEVTVMKVMDDPLSHDKRIIVATVGGELVMLDRNGNRLNMICVESGISDIKILTYPQHNRVDIVLVTSDGRVIICDNNFLIRASVVVGNTPIKGVILGGKCGEEYQIYCVTGNAIHLLQYHPYFLRKSRHY
jgi:outer membrane protein assembly factor BamB